MFCLRTPTDPAWAKQAVGDLDAVLVDHAHCEMKAATNALSLVVRHSSDLGLVRALTDLAREELDHFRRVIAFLERRGLSLGAPPVDAYAAELRRAMGALPQADVPPLVDRLLVGALIEARSCERFKLLLDALPADTSVELRVFYEELFACEARHYRTYVDLATQAQAGHWRGKGAARDIDSIVQVRLAHLADAEGAIVRSLTERDRRATVHG
ncbi:MAG: tRNA-(ms[2]io[6]A)-hydroxylase [Labilithrix sp.]|nr:tRNA-(ms[2]io[6]A)-hydroxylase [Labilithrix sp.]